MSWWDAPRFSAQHVVAFVIAVSIVEVLVILALR